MSHHHGHEDHSGHEGQMQMQMQGQGHQEHSAVAAISSTVATIINKGMEGLQAHMASGDHAGHMGYGPDESVQIKHDHSMHTNHGDMSDMDDMDHGMMHNMIMYFHTGYNETVLFESWKFNTMGGLIGSMVGIFFMAALYEGLKYYREYLFWRTYNALQYRSVTIPPEKGVVSEDNQIVHMVGEVIHKQPPTMFSWMHGFQTCLHMLQIVLSYFLMLIFMTYNVWLCLAVVVGAGVGYFLFGWKKSVIVDVTEHCH